MLDNPLLTDQAVRQQIGARMLGTFRWHLEVHSRRKPPRRLLKSMECLAGEGAREPNRAKAVEGGGLRSE